MVMPYYGCPGGHPEFTCLSAYYVGPKKFQKFTAWCDWCRDHYQFPKED